MLYLNYMNFGKFLFSTTFLIHFNLVKDVETGTKRGVKAKLFKGEHQFCMEWYIWYKFLLLVGRTNPRKERKLKTYGN